MPSALASRCRHEFSHQDRSRGLAYFQGERVEVQGAGRGVHAEVSGSLPWPYSVVLRWTSDTLEVDCDCPRFEDVGLCKHLWATVLAADAADLTASAPGDGPLEVVPLEDVEWEGLSAETDWAQALASVRYATTVRAPRDRARPPRVEVFYVLDIRASLAAGGLVIAFYQRRERRDGQLGVMKRLSVDETGLRDLPDPHREILELLLSLSPRVESYWGEPRKRTARQVVVPGGLYGIVLPRLAGTGRLLLWSGDTRRPEWESVLEWDEGPPWRLELVLEEPEEGWSELRGVLRRGEETVPLEEPELLLAAGLVVFSERVARLAAREHFPWVPVLRREGALSVPAEETGELLAALHELPALPRLRLPPGLEVRRVRGSPRPRLALHRLYGPRWRPELLGRVDFLYGGMEVEPGDARSAVADEDLLMVRDPGAEEAALGLLREAGLREEREPGDGSHFLVPEGRVVPLVEKLLEAGWRVEAEGATVRRSGSTSLRVESGIDWFELSGSTDFDGREVPFPRLLQAAAGGERLVRLDDGTLGLLPAEWLSRYGSLGRLAQGESEGSLRFSRAQGPLLDALLSELPAVDLDASFARLRRRLESFQGFSEAQEPRGFHGELRPYQRLGLGWLRGLAGLELGGCLADDMGLGKTVQLLAFLQWRRARPVSRDRKRPSMVVAPRSVVFNWVREAERFAPHLRTMEYAGPGRKELRREIPDRDLVVTTYDTLRRDITELRSIHFDTVALDEAQAIKNPGTLRAKACRLLEADHRFALTGTPVENHLGDLWSIFEFLNPGLLGPLAARNLGRRAATADREELARLAGALAPFILRRTKEQVAADLPPRSEQVLYCDLPVRQRRLYDELRDHYRASLAGQLEERGLARSKIQVLEALLRLRQAACHPGLVDADRVEEGSAKLEMLLEQLRELVEEGHKAVVFSQFTKLLAIVRRSLESEGISFEYLDGRTRKRDERVDRFQDDPDCPVFLISLKAGGVGLNLTAAGYVFLLDPWWNPAVEAQAIDRTHRIGQTQPVLAYRLIGRDTVEEKILELQRKKRELAEAVITGRESLLRSLTVEDLELLLG